jgi:hypothetical protein
MVQKRRDFDRPHVFRVTQLVEEDVAPDPMRVGLLGLQTVSASTHRLAQPGNKPGLLGRRLQPDGACRGIRDCRVTIDLR